MADEVSTLRDKAKQQMGTTAVLDPPTDPSPNIPASAPSAAASTTASERAPSVRRTASPVTPAATPPVPESVAAVAPVAPVPPRLPAIPRNKACRVIRVKTEEGVVAMINASDYDPEMKGHTALTPEDEKWGKMAVDARQRADYEAEKVAAIKRVVRGG